MKKASLRATAALAVVPVAAGLSMPVLAVAVVVALTAVAAICWTITDKGRSKRLAMLISAIRGNNARRPRAVTQVKLRELGEETRRSDSAR
jgi:hypothetical protein